MLDVIIIGAGLSGVAAARHLKAKGLKIQVIEAANRVGGREKTDHYQGFLLDHGFHVFLTAYPEAQKVLDYEALALKPFYNGALIWSNGKLAKVADPWRHPMAALPSIINQVGNLTDKFKVKTLKDKLLSQSDTAIFNSPESTTLNYLKEYGFSDQFIKQFFKPFLGGVFLESELQTFSHFFEFVFKMFSLGEATLPSQGIQAIPQQLASSLAPSEILLNSRVTQVRAGAVTLEDGTLHEAKVILIATDAKDAELLTDQPSPAFNSTYCVYFSAPKPPVSEPILVLNGTGKGIVNNLCVPTLVCPSYSSSNLHLISVSLLETNHSIDQLPTLVKSELTDWFGISVKDWVHLKTYAIPRALPAFSSSRQITGKLYNLGNGIFSCGDYLETPSINGALVSGRKASEAILQYLETRA